MAKRFTDTEKWNDEWWGSLPNDYRMIWLYLVDSCDIAGVWKKSFRSLNFNCNTNIDEAKFIEIFGSKVVDLSDSFFIKKFIVFQYPKGLISNKPAVVSVRNFILNSKYSNIIIESLPNDYQIVKGNGIRKGNGNGNSKGEGIEKEPENFGKSENLLIIPEMLRIFKSHNPNYLSSESKDYRPLFSIASYLCEVGKLSGSPDLHRDLVLEAWEPICKVIKADKFYSQKSLVTISNHIQEILQISLHGKSTDNKPNYGSKERAKEYDRLFAERYGKG